MRKLCFDILRAIGEIEEFTSGIDLQSYRQNRIVRLAVERDYEIIGEALKRMLARFQAEFLQITDGRKIIDFRNLLAHAYDDIADEIVWDITTNKLSNLRSEIEGILSNQE